MSMVTGPSHSAAARAAGSSDSIRLVTTARPCSTACQCVGVIRRASPAVVVDARPGTGVIAWPATSARWRSSPVRKSSPASCAAAIPVSSSPAPKPRSRCLMGPTAASTASITPSRSHNSVTTARPALRRQRRIRRADPHLLTPPDRQNVSCSPDRCPLRWAGHHLAAIIIPGQSGTYRHLQGRVTGLLVESGQRPRSLIPAGDVPCLVPVIGRGGPWHGSWHGSPADMGAMRVMTALAGGILAGRGAGAPGRTTFKPLVRRYSEIV